MSVFTTEYLAAAVYAKLEIVYPDGAVWKTPALAAGNGALVGSIRDAIAWRRGSDVTVCARNLDRLRRAHADAAERNPAHVSSQWDAARDKELRR